jgi:hypothetical protein
VARAPRAEGPGQDVSAKRARSRRGSTPYSACVARRPRTGSGPASQSPGAAILARALYTYLFCRATREADPTQRQRSLLCARWLLEFLRSCSSSIVSRDARDELAAPAHRLPGGDHASVRGP